MKKESERKSTALVLSVSCVLGRSSAASGQAVKQEIQQKLANVKESVVKNQAVLRRYMWTEHTDISLKDEVKKTMDNLCRYGADGKVAEKKAGELTDDMERAPALIHLYMPPAPDSMQAAKVEQGGSMKGSDLIALKANSITMGGRRQQFTRKTPGGAGLGAAIGAIAGRAILWGSGQPHFKIPAESILQFQLLADLKIQRPAGLAGDLNERQGEKHEQNSNDGAPRASLLRSGRHGPGCDVQLRSVRGLFEVQELQVGANQGCHASGSAN